MKNIIGKNIDFYHSDSNRDELIDKIENLEDDVNPIVYVTNEDGKNVYIGTDKVTDVYNSKAGDTWRTTEVGGVSSGLSKSQLEKYSTSEILDMILFKVEQPTLKRRNSISVKFRDNNDSLILVGTPLLGNNDLILSYDRGEWSDGTPYAGPVNFEDVTISKDGTVDDSSGSDGLFGDISTEGKYTITYSVRFGDGDYPKDNRGEDATVVPYRDRNIETRNIYVYAVYPVYINDTESIEDELNPHFVNYINGSSIEVVIPAESETLKGKFTIDIPEGVKMNVYQWYEMTNAYDTKIEMIATDSYYDDGDGVKYVKYVRTLDKFSVNTMPVKYKIELRK